MEQSMTALAALAGWKTVPHADDHKVVRLALTTAKARHDPDSGGNREVADLVLHIEDQWLQTML